MAQSLCKIYLHIIFHIKTTSPKLEEEHLSRVHAYIGQITNNTSCKAIRVGGVSDHVHIVCQLGRDETISHLVEELKRNSSRWLKTIDPRYHNFAWQGGYAALSISQSLVDKTVQYVNQQKEHHKRQSFNDEYLQFLKLYNIDYDQRYVFTD